MLVFHLFETLYFILYSAFQKICLIFNKLIYIHSSYYNIFHIILKKKWHFFNKKMNKNDKINQKKMTKMTFRESNLAYIWAHIHGYSIFWQKPDRPRTPTKLFSLILRHSIRIYFSDFYKILWYSLDYSLTIPKIQKIHITFLIKCKTLYHIL